MRWICLVLGAVFIIAGWIVTTDYHVPVFGLLFLAISDVHRKLDQIPRWK